MTQREARLPKDNGYAKRRHNNNASKSITIAKATATAIEEEKLRQQLPSNHGQRAPKSPTVGSTTPTPETDFAASASASTTSSHHYPLPHTTILPYL